LFFVSSLHKEKMCTDDIKKNLERNKIHCIREEEEKRRDVITMSSTFFEIGKQY